MKIVISGEAAVDVATQAAIEEAAELNLINAVKGIAQDLIGASGEDEDSWDILSVSIETDGEVIVSANKQGSEWSYHLSKHKKSEGVMVNAKRSKLYELYLEIEWGELITAEESINIKKRIAEYSEEKLDEEIDFYTYLLDK